MMGSAVKLRADYSAAEFRRLARASKDECQSSRLLSIAAVLDGMSRANAARIGGMDRELFGQGRIRIEDVSRLSLAHHMDHLDAGQDDRSRCW